MLNKRGFFSDYSLLNEGDYASHESTLAAERAANQRNSTNNGISRNLTNLRNDAEDARRAREAIQSQNKLQQLSNYNNFLNQTSDTDHLSVSDLADVRKGIAQQQSDWDAANSDRNVENLRAFNRFNTDRRLSNLEAENTRKNDADFHNSFTISNNFDPKLWDQARKQGDYASHESTLAAERAANQRNSINNGISRNLTNLRNDAEDAGRVREAEQQIKIKQQNDMQDFSSGQQQMYDRAYNMSKVNNAGITTSDINTWTPEQQAAYNNLTTDQQQTFMNTLKGNIEKAKFDNTLKEVGSAISGFDGEKAKLAIQNWWQYNPHSGVQLTAGIIGTILVGAGLYTAAKKWREYRARKKAMEAA